MSSRIQKFSAKEGKYLDKVGEGYVDIAGGTPWFDSEKNLWIANEAASPAVWAFGGKSPFEPVNQFGEGGYVEGKFGEPTDLAADSNGNFWVTDALYNRVEKWTAAPAAITSAASDITAPTASFNGTVNPRGLETTYHFEYGKTTSYGTSIPVPDKSVGAGTSDVKISQTVEGLETSTTYHFRLAATNSHGTTYGADQTFTTPEWGIQTTPEPTGAKSGRLAGVSCTTSVACVAVGSYTNSSGTEVTLAKVKSGSTWSVTTTPNPAEATSSALKRVSCSTTGSCTAVGNYSNSKTGLSSPFAERWNGSTWTLQSMPAPPAGTEYNIEDVACPASSDCTAVGWSWNGSIWLPLAMRWNGTSWSLSSIPLPEGATRAMLHGITCVTSLDCWAVGWRNGPSNVLAEHWNGTAWTVNSPASFAGELGDIACGSTSSCVAVVKEGTAAARWNGTSWSKETLPTPEGTEFLLPTGVSCTSASTCVVAAKVVVGGKTKPLALGWNGSSWSSQSTSFPAGKEWAAFEDVSCSSGTICTTVGVSYSSSAAALVEARH
jgi:hypothetical protein